MDVRLCLGWGNLHRSAARELFNALQVVPHYVALVAELGAVAVDVPVALLLLLLLLLWVFDDLTI